MHYEKGDRVISQKGSHGTVTGVFTRKSDLPNTYSVMWDGEAYSTGMYTADEIRPEKEKEPMFKKGDRVVKSNGKMELGIGTVDEARKRKGENRYDIIWDNASDTPFYNYTDDELLPAPVEKPVESVMERLVKEEEKIVAEIEDLQSRLASVRVAKEVVEGLNNES